MTSLLRARVGYGSWNSCHRDHESRWFVDLGICDDGVIAGRSGVIQAELCLRFKAFLRELVIRSEETIYSPIYPGTTLSHSHMSSSCPEVQRLMHGIVRADGLLIADDDPVIQHARAHHHIAHRKQRKVSCMSSPPARPGQKV